jgi:hypothetical protein
MDHSIPFSDLTLFVCTYVAKITNINMSFKQLTPIICDNLTDVIIAINSNYGHAAMPGYEYLIKHPKKPVVSENYLYLKGKSRKVQGDGTCFNSAIEPVIKLPNSKENKFYFLKCFPTTGETQIPGVILDDFSDGYNVLTVFVKYLNTLKDIKIDDNELIGISYSIPKMINYKFKLNHMTSSMLVNLFKVAEYLQKSEQRINTDNITIPFIIKEVKLPVDDIKISFRMKTSEKRNPRINIFQGGKINILGAESTTSARLIYEYMTNIFKMYWHDFITIKPLSDKEKEAITDTHCL